MKRGDKVLLFVDILGFAQLTEEWPRRIVHRRKGSMRFRGTSDASNRLSIFHSILDQVVQEFARQSNSITAMSFSDCAFVLVGGPYVTAEFAAELMQCFVTAMVPVRMGMAAGTFSPGRQSSDLIGRSSISRAIFYGTAIVRANRAEGTAAAGMRIFLDESLETVADELGPRPVIKFKRKEGRVFGELSYLHHVSQYHNVQDKATVEEDDLRMWNGARIMRRVVNHRAPRRVHQHYLQTLAALQNMRKIAGKAPFRKTKPF